MLRPQDHKKLQGQNLRELKKEMDNVRIQMKEKDLMTKREKRPKKVDQGMTFNAVPQEEVR